ncbi:MAG: hypothetical protein H7Z16_11975 [Pyrinomonadaceae bacterium]|nr:hypothetical protein [Pyrinomonadaceae bacterium]
MSGSKHKGNGKLHVTETPDVSHIKNLDVTHEASDVSVGGILKFVVGLTIFAVVVHVLMWGMFRLLKAQEEKEPSPGPMAMTEQERLPPAPRLQAATGFGIKLENGEWVNLENREPEAEYRVLRTQWEQILSGGLKDQSGKVVGMPIDQAMEKILEAGVPSRKQSEGSTGTVDSRLKLPTAESSGRVAGQ